MLFLERKSNRIRKSCDKEVSLKTRSKSVVLAALILVSMLFVLEPNLRTVSAVPSVATNWNGEYVQSWTGIRPTAGAQTGTNLNIYQRVISHNYDNSAEAFLSTEVYTLQQGSSTSPIDTVNLRLTLNANSRYGIGYTYTTGSLPSPYPTSFTSWTDLGVVLGWVNLQYPIVFYGDYQTSTNQYNRLYVSDYGYLSVFGPNYGGSGLSQGIIAPFFRNQIGHVYTWYDSANQDTYFRWKTNSQVPCCPPEDFLVVLRNWSNIANSPYHQSGIEFWYNSITPTDGVGTTVGIANEYGAKTVSIPSSSLGNTNYMVGITASSGTKYLSSLAFNLVDTSNGANDGFARVIFDPITQTTYHGEPAGNNIVFATTAPGSVTLPDYARTAFTLAGQVAPGAALLPPPFNTAGLAIATVSGSVPFGVDTYNQLINNYWAPQLSVPPTDQSSFGSSDSAHVKASAALGFPGGGTSTSQEPTDASFSIKVQWLFQDVPQRNVPHHLQVVATVGYCCFAPGGGVTIPGPDTWTMSTSVDLEVDPDYLIKSDTFATGTWSSDYSSSTPSTQWTVTQQCNDSTAANPLTVACFASTFSAYSGNAPNTNYGLVYNLGSLVNFAQLIVYLHFWVPGGAWIFIDYQLSDGWHNIISVQGDSDGPTRTLTPNTRWISPRLVLPTSATAMRFTFSTGTSAPSTGAYIGDIFLLGDGPGNSATVRVLGQTDGGAPLAVPITMDGGASYTTTAYFLATTGVSHQFTAPLTYTDTTGTYNFKSSSCSSSTTCSLSVTGPTQFSVTYVVVPDFTISANPASTGIYAGYTGTVAITLTSRNHWSGSVSLSSTVSPSGLSASCSPTNFSLTDGGTASSSCILSSSTVGSYSATFTGTGGGLVRTVVVPLTVCCSGSGGGSGSGSLAQGTLITMVGGGVRPVQNLRVNDSLLGYDPYAGTYGVATILDLKTVVTNNMLIIYTANGIPLRTDASPTEILWTKLQNQTSLWLPVTQLSVGDSLYTQNGWVAVLSIRLIPGGTYTMYDLATTAPYFANGYLDPIHPS